MTTIRSYSVRESLRRTHRRIAAAWLATLAGAAGLTWLAYYPPADMVMIGAKAFVWTLLGMAALAGQLAGIDPSWALSLAP